MELIRCSMTAGAVAIFLLFAVLNAANAQVSEGQFCDRTIVCPTGKFLECQTQHVDLPGVCRCEKDRHFDIDLDTCLIDAGSTCTATPPTADCALNSKCSGTPPKCTCDAGWTASERGKRTCVKKHGEDCDLGSPLQDCDASADLRCTEVFDVRGRFGTVDVADVLEDTTEASTTVTEPPPPDSTTPIIISKCMCDSSTRTYSVTREKCVRKARQSCQAVSGINLPDDFCVENSLCSNLGFCECLPGFGISTLKAGDGICYAQRLTSCSANSECNEDQNTICAGNRCECKPNSVYFATVSKCQFFAGQECAGNTDCQSGECHPGIKKCVCPVNTLQLVDGTCGPLGRENGNGRYDDYCKDESDCDGTLFHVCDTTATGQTSYGLCRCEAGMVYELGACRTPIGEDCSRNRNCGQNAFCSSENVCECGPGTSETAEKACQVNRGGICNSLTNPCRNDYGLVCTAGNICGCPAGQQWPEAPSSEEHPHCVALVAGNCTQEPAHCLKNSHCNGAGMCECDAGYTHEFDYPGSSAAVPYDARICVGSIGTFCNATEPCNTASFLTCVAESGEDPGIGSGTCQCRYPLQQTFDEKSGQCLSLSGGFCGKLGENNLEMRCEENAECLQNVHGIFKCACLGAAVEDGKACSSAGEGTTTPGDEGSTPGNGAGVGIFSMSTVLGVFILTPGILVLDI